MCCQYWNLKDVAFVCPACGKTTTDTLQTHFMGDFSFRNYYTLGQRVPELGDVTVTLGRDGPDEFAGHCNECDTFLDFGGQIENGAVTAVWPLELDASA